jgi:ribA/ribD-fused uncharacterized protein
MIVKNNILLFVKGPFSQWFGAWDGQEAGRVTIPTSAFTPFIKSYSEQNLADFWSEYSQTDKIQFNCAEQSMMFGKAVIFGDILTAAKILTHKQPSEQKNLGRKVTQFDPAYWDQIKLPLVSVINIHKFKQNPSIAKLLTDDYKHHIIAEAAPWDKVWGIGLAEDDEKAWNVETWEGENLLGEALMAVRRQLIRAQIIPSKAQIEAKEKDNSAKS